MSLPDSSAAKAELLCCIATQLGESELIEYCGGSKMASKYMLPLLEKLIMVEEAVIRHALTYHHNIIVYVFLIFVYDLLQMLIHYINMVKNDAYKNLVLLINNMQSHQLILAYTKPLLENLTTELMENMGQCIIDITLKIAEKIEAERNKILYHNLLKQQLKMIHGEYVNI